MHYYEINVRTSCIWDSQVDELIHSKVHFDISSITNRRVEQIQGNYTVSHIELDFMDGVNLFQIYEICGGVERQLSDLEKEIFIHTVKVNAHICEDTTHPLIPMMPVKSVKGKRKILGDPRAQINGADRRIGLCIHFSMNDPGYVDAYLIMSKKSFRIDIRIPCQLCLREPL